MWPLTLFYILLPSRVSPPPLVLVLVLLRPFLLLLVLVLVLPLLLLLALPPTLADGPRRCYPLGTGRRDANEGMNP